jgi:UDP-GlcNAc:undecaprenyl-phosphate/decaprenyl-phosphate GlcNAc-1-phosphate transferase
MITLLASFISFLIGFLLTPIVILVLRKTDFLDSPGGRKIHKSQVPSMGGVAFVMATVITSIILLDFLQLTQLKYFIAAFVLMFFVGFRDDMVDLSASQKILGQLVCAYLIVVMSGIRFTSLYGFMGIYEIPLWLSYGLTVFTLLVLTNSFNLIDGLDGLAGSISVVTFLFLGWWFYQAGMGSYSLFSIILVSAVLSFLVYNWHPAKIFMGDTGSLSLGFALAVLTILFIDTNGTMTDSEGVKFNAPIASGVALLIIPIYDTLRIFIKRTLKKKSPLAPDKSHVHHFLLRMGLRHDQVSLMMVFIKLLFIGIIFLGKDLTDHVLLPLVALFAVILGIIMDKATLERVKKINKAAPPILSLRLKAKIQGKHAIQAGMFEEVQINSN